MANLLDFFKQKQVKEMPQDFFFGRGKSTVSSLSTSKDFLNTYIDINYIGKCVNIIASDIAKLDWDYVNAKGDIVEIPELDKLLNNPCENLTNNEWTNIITSHLLLDGNAFILLYAKNAYDLKAGKPTELLPLNPALVEIVKRDGSFARANDHSIDKDDIIGYQVNFDGELRLIKKEDKKIIHIKLPSVFNTIRGLGVIQQNLATLGNDKVMTDFIQSIFANGGTSKLVYKTRLMSNKDFEDFKRRVQRDIDLNKAGIMFLNGPDSEIKGVTVTFSSLQILEQKKLMREDIRSMFGLPALLTGEQSDINRANANEQLRVYRELVLPRYFTYIQEALSQLVKLYGKDLSFQYKNDKIIDIEAMTTTVATLFDRGIVNGNEARTLLGLPDLTEPSLNEYFVQSNLMPISMATMPLPAPVNEPKSCGCHDTKDMQELDEVKPLIKPSRRQWRILRQARLNKSKVEQDIVKSLNKFYKDLEKAVLAQLPKGLDDLDKKITGNELFSMDLLIAEAKKESQRFFTSGVTIGINDINDLYKNTYDSSFKNPKVRLVVDKLGTNYATLTLNTRKNEVYKLVQDSVTQGWSNSELTGAFKDYFEDLTGREGWKAWRIARTEASNAWDSGALLNYQDLGVKTLDVVGCEDMITDCNRRGVPINEADGLVFHPNHTGCLCPSESEF
jgi:HK97 family phage portal protein